MCRWYCKAPLQSPTLQGASILNTATDTLIVRHLGDIAYPVSWQWMQNFTDRRDDASRDEIWILQHPAVFTLGQAGKPEHLLNPGNIPVIKTDRGGQVTYHGPGQLVMYLLVDLRRKKIGVRQLVDCIEQAIIALLKRYAINAKARADAPGVYINEAKIAALGLRVRRGCSYHGLAFNVDPDLSPFKRINPCGYEGMAVTRLADQIGTSPDIAQISEQLLEELQRQLGYTARITIDEQPLV